MTPKMLREFLIYNLIKKILFENSARYDTVHWCGTDVKLYYSTFLSTLNANDRIHVF